MTDEKHGILWAFLSERVAKQGRCYSRELAAKGAELGLKRWDIERFRASVIGLEARKERRWPGSRWYLCHQNTSKYAEARWEPPGAAQDSR